MDDITKIKINELVFKSLEGIISKEERSELESLLRSDPQAIKYYTASIDFNLGMQKIGKCMPTPLQMEMFLQELAQHEKTAPEIEIPQKQPQRELIQKVVYPHREKRKLSTFSKVFLTMNAAAILFIVLFLKFAPPEPVEVATLSDSMNAKWADIDSSMRKGVRLVDSRKKLMLREGFAELTFDNTAHVVIEAPAEFQILADDRIGLTYGKLYATVPLDAVGFSVYTPNAKIIDLGTEFGVQADFNGNTKLSVLKGKILLAAGGAGKTKMEVSEGTSKKISGKTGNVSDIRYRSDYFVRKINSEAAVAWRGQSEINLAYLVDGGNGLAPGQITSGIDPGTGKVHLKSVQKNRSGEGGYKAAPKRQFIDGVFIPNSVDGPTIVSSAGHMFAFPKTDGGYYSDITSNPYAHKLFPQSDIALSLSPLAPGKTTDSPLIFLHASVGVTFNLDKIRQSFGHLEIDRFKSSCGISQGTGEINRSEFWVLLDGQCVFHNTLDLNHPEAREIDISITSEHKFLTLATTNGGDTYNMDWCIFENPRVEVIKE